MITDKKVNENDEQIIANIDKFITNRDITALGHWYSKGITWIQDLIMDKASSNGEVFKQRILNVSKKVKENSMEHMEESTTTASVGGQYVTPFFLKKKKINEDGTNTLEYGTYRDLFKYIMLTQKESDNEEFAHDLNDFQIEVAMHLNGNIDQEVSEDDLSKLEQVFTKHGVDFNKETDNNDMISGDVDLDTDVPSDLQEINSGEMTNLELFELSEGIIESLGDNSPYTNKIISVLETVLNVDEPNGVVDMNELSELYNLVREIENGGTIEDYFQTEIAIPSLNEEKIKAEKLLQDVHKENSSNEPEFAEPKVGEEGEVDSDNQKPEIELGDGESEFKRASKGQEDIKYDAISDADKTRHNELIDQDVNSESVEDQNGFKVDKMTNPNAIESDVAKDMLKTAEENAEKDLHDPHYVKDPQPVKIVKEEVDDDDVIVKEGEDYQITKGEMKIIKEEVELMNKFLNFNPKKASVSKNKNKVDVLQIIRDLNKK